MKFLLLVAFAALISFAYMQVNDYVTDLTSGYDSAKTTLTKYFHKKMCYCVKTKDATCERLQCCELYKYVPYKFVVKMCKFGNCKFITEEDDEDEIIGGGEEEDRGSHI